MNEQDKLYDLAEAAISDLRTTIDDRDERILDLEDEVKELNEKISNNE